jgi:hypothetical protein
VARPCTTCLSSSREAVERALLDGEPVVHVAERYGLARTSLRRHRDRHLAPSLSRAIERREDVNADRLVSWLSDLHAKALVGMETAKRRGDLQSFRALLREDRETCGLLARLAGILGADGATVNVSVDARRAEVYSTLSEGELRALAALDGEPEAVEVLEANGGPGALEARSSEAP